VQLGKRQQKNVNDTHHHLQVVCNCLDTTQSLFLLDKACRRSPWLTLRGTGVPHHPTRKPYAARKAGQRLRPEVKDLRQGQAAKKA
jgi:hypothetical protein